MKVLCLCLNELPFIEKGDTLIIESCVCDECRDKQAIQSMKNQMVMGMIDHTTRSEEYLMALNRVLNIAAGNVIKNYQKKGE
jgi:hypothetical protein